MKESISLPVFEKTKPYTIDWHYYQEGFTVFQKKYVLLRNRIMMLVFAGKCLGAGNGRFLPGL